MKKEKAQSDHYNSKAVKCCHVSVYETPAYINLSYMQVSTDIFHYAVLLSNFPLKI